MRITENKYYQININKNVSPNRHNMSTPAFKMGANKPLQAVNGLEKTVQQTGMWTKIKTFIAGSFLAGLFGLSIKKDEPMVDNSASTLQADDNKQNEVINEEEIAKKQAEEFQRKKVFELETIMDKPYLLQSFFKKYPHIDLNVRDENGDTLFLKAVRNNNKKFIRDLMQAENQGLIKNIDKDAVDKDGNNALNIAEETDSIYFLLSEERHDYIKMLLDAGVSPNYINKSERLYSFYCTLLQRAIIRRNSDLADLYLQNEKTDIKMTHPDTPPPLFLCVTNRFYNHKILLSILKHPDCDIFQKYNDMNILEYLNSQPDMASGVIEQASSAINSKIMLHIWDKAKKYYQEKGILNLEQLYEYVKHPGFKAVVNEPLNELGENIGHFLADINTDDYDELMKIRDLITTLNNCSYNFAKTDKLGRTPLMKAIEAENVNIAHLFLDYGTNDGNSLAKAKKLAMQSENKNIITIFAGTEAKK